MLLSELLKSWIDKQLFTEIRQRLIFLDKPKIKDWIGLKLSNFKGVIAMMSDIPIDLTKVNKTNINKEILRVAIIAELDAINLYEQLAAITENNDIKMILMDVAKEEKTHVGEFQTLLLGEDKQQVEELKAGEEEVKKELGK
jgi:hypothetical protein